MVNRVVVSLIILLMFLGIFIYFRVEMKYSMVMNGRASDYLRSLSSAKSAAEIADTVEKKGVQFALDYKLIEDFLLKTCNPNCYENADFYRAHLKIVKEIKAKRLWVVKQNRFKDSVSYYIQDGEEKKLEEHFLATREKISAEYTKIKSMEHKQLALDVIKALDEKIVELRKK